MRLVYLLVGLFACISINAQYTLSGYVTNENYEALDAAIIYIEGTQLSTISKPDGTYRLDSIPEGRQIIQVTYLGYEKKTFNIDMYSDIELDITITGILYDLDEIEIISNRIKPSQPFTFSMETKEELSKKNLGQDIPFLLNNTPSAVVTSDAGNGIGYTGLRIRGTDQSRINVTINGVPINDAESQGVFWVNMPDIAASVSDIQVQRGVGPSTNGAGAYGGSVSISTKDVNINPYAKVSATYGSFDTRKLGISLGTGLIDNKFSIDARYSIINSDGYVDRASTDLSSYYIGVSKVTSQSSLRFITFSGKERTYQSWYGTPESKVKGDDAALLDHYNNNVGSLYNTSQDSINLFDSDRRYNFYQYEDQVDDYSQTHYQLHYAYDFDSPLSTKFSLFYTQGRGFFEQFRYDDSFVNYGLEDLVIDSMIISSSNLVRRRWLDNDLFGGLFNAIYDVNDNFELSFGGGINRYIGDHFGNIVSIEIPRGFDPGTRYYDNTGKKSDGNVYLRGNYKSGTGLHAYVDLQVRNVDYTVDGIDSDRVPVSIDTSYLFFNPKLGLSYDLAKGNVYASFALANREPDRSDFLDNPRSNTPLSESLYNYELGYRHQTSSYMIGSNIYFMDYTNQLVQTGDLNDVGSVLRDNIADSYRLGIELEMGYQINKYLLWDWNLALSQNKIKEFNEVLFDYTNGFERIETKYENVDIAFSPSIVWKNNFVITPIENLSATIETQYVGKQYLDNTQSEDKKLNGYLVNNLRLNYMIDPSFINKIDVTLMVNNLFNSLYSANGYTYSYIFGEKITENYLYPQAGINVLLGATVTF